MHQSTTISGGWDVHKASLAVASLAQAHHAEGVSLGHIGPRQGEIDTRIRTLHSQSPPLVLVSAAGPCGSGLSRSLTTTGQRCWVVAPSCIPKQSGKRGHTHRRDASKRARLMRSGDVTPVSVPQVEDAAMRALRRARPDARHDRKTATWRRTAFLLRQDLRSTGRATWGPALLRWRSEVGCPTPAPPSVFQASVRAVNAHPARLQRREHARKAQGQTGRLAPVVDALQALRGVQGTVAVTTVAARGDLPRFEPPRPLMHSLGFTPSEDSTGERRRQGGITQTGHPHARRALLEGAWASRSPATGSRPLHRRLAQGPKPLQARSGKAHVRLGQRSQQLIARGKHAHQVVGAIARALCALLWAMAPEVPRPP